MFQYSFRSGLILLFFFISTSVLLGQSRESLIESVNSLPEWKASGSPVVFNDVTDSKLEPELNAVRGAYDIAGVTLQSWQSPSGKVRAALFQFADASAAYSFFSIRRKFEGMPSSDFSAGADSFKSGKYHYFWQSAYVVRMDGSVASIQLLSGILSEKILGRSQRPSLSNHLPTKNVIAGSETYILDSANFKETEGRDASSFGFDFSAQAAAADYRVEGNKAHLLLLLYPTQQIAKKIEDQILSTTPGKTTSRKRVGPLLAIVSGLTDASMSQSLLEQVHYQSTVTWSEPQPGLGLGPIIVTAFTFIGILVALSLLVGVGLGYGRTIAQSLYPNRSFEREKDAEIIQLKLDQ